MSTLPHLISTTFDDLLPFELVLWARNFKPDLVTLCPLDRNYMATNEIPWKRSLTQEYNIDPGKPLGVGSFGVVKRCYHKETGRAYAIKAIRKEVGSHLACALARLTPAPASHSPRRPDKSRKHPGEGGLGDPRPAAILVTHTDTAARRPVVLTDNSPPRPGAAEVDRAGACGPQERGKCDEDNRHEPQLPHAHRLF